MNELDDELNFLRKPNRLVRRPSFKQTNLNNGQKSETNQLMSFLTNGLEESRELPSFKNLLTSSNSDLNNKENNNSFRNSPKTQIENLLSPLAVANIKRYSSTGNLNTVNSPFPSPVIEKSKFSILESPEESHESISNEIKPSTSFRKYQNEKTINTNTVASGITMLEKPSDKIERIVEPDSEKLYPVMLRRSSSTTEVDQVYYKARKEIASEVLPEDVNSNSYTERKVQKESYPNHIVNDTNNIDSQLKSANRLHGLKKLGSLYKTFEDEIEESNKSPKPVTLEDDQGFKFSEPSYHDSSQSLFQMKENNGKNQYNSEKKNNTDIRVSRPFCVRKEDVITQINGISNDNNNQISNYDQTLKLHQKNMPNLSKNNENKISLRSSFPSQNIKQVNSQINSVNNFDYNFSSNSEMNKSDHITPSNLSNVTLKRANSLYTATSEREKDNGTEKKDSIISNINHEILNVNEQNIDNKVKSLSKNWENVANKIENGSHVSSNSIIRRDSINKSNLENIVNRLRINRNENNMGDEKIEGQYNGSRFIEMSNRSNQENQPTFSNHNINIQSQFTKINFPNCNSINNSIANSTNSIVSNLVNASQFKREHNEELENDGNRELHLNIPRQQNHSVNYSKNDVQYQYENKNSNINLNVQSESTTNSNDSFSKNKIFQNVSPIKKMTQQPVAKVIQNGVFPLKSNISASSNNIANSNSPPATPVQIDENAFNFNDINKRKSGSALYLNDTASTKAKRIEVKHKDNKPLLTNNNNINFLSNTSVSHISNTVFSNNNNSTNGLNNASIIRRASINNGMTRKPTDKLNVNINMTKESTQIPTLSNSSSQSSMKNSSNISLSINCSSQNFNQSHQLETNQGIHLNYHSSDNIDTNGYSQSNKKPSVFDRLSKTIKRDIH